MYNLILRKRGTGKLIYSTSLGFRITFILTSALIVVSVLYVSGGRPFARVTPVEVAILLVCSFAGLYIERWQFDRRKGIFERNVGLIFLHTHRRLSLDSLDYVLIRTVGQASPRRGRWVLSSSAATLSIVERNGRIIRVDVARGNAIEELRETGRRIAAFCDLEIEERNGVTSGGHF